MDKKFKKYYALKEISKVKVIDKKSINSIIYERELLSRLNHSLIINLKYAFQDYNNLYLVLDLLTGGDLRYQIGHHRKRYFTEQQTKFFISCIIESLIYIHSKNIIHRDIKPENLVFDSKGYLHTTDFGIAKFISKKNRHETSGTPGYMAPEVMKGLDHTKSVDFFAVGVITYELMMGKRPYIGKNRKEIKDEMMSKQIYIDKEMLPFDWSEESADFINKLLIRKDIKRLGYNNDLEIKNHPWFNDINFDELVKKNIEAPFLPKMNHDNYDKKYCGEIEKIGFDTNFRYEEYKANENYSDLFYGFTFYNVDESQLQIYKKPNVRYIQNQKNSILRNKNCRESKTIDLDNLEHLNKLLNDIKLIQKINIIDGENDIKSKDINTLDVEDNNNKILNNNENVIDKNINIYFESNDTKREKNKKNYTSSVHKRMSSNLIGHNYLYFLQKKKLFNSHKKANSFQNMSINNSNTINNNSNSQNKNSIKQKINQNSINYHKMKKKYEKKLVHEHSNSYCNNLYANLINKIKKESEDLRNRNLIEGININNQNKKKSIEIDHISRFENIKNNYQSVKNIKNKSDIYSSIDNNDSISSINCNNDISQKVDMMKASTNFYSRQEIPYNKLNRITPINLRNRNISFNLNSKFSNDSNNILDSINIDKTIINPKRSHIKVKTRSLSKKPFLDYSNSNTHQKIVNMISSEEHSLENKKILFNVNKKVSKVLPMTHNYSYSSFNNKNKIDSLIRSLIESDKPKKNTIPIDIKKTSNTIKNSKVSTLHKKIPIPASFCQKTFHKRLNGYIVKKLKNITNNSYSSSNNNSINNSSLSKNYNNFFNNNTKSSSISKIMKKEIKFNNINSNIIFPNTTINANKKKIYKINLNKKSNDFNALLKKLNDFSKNHKKKMTFGSNINYSSLNVGNKENNSKKFKIKSNFIKTQIKKIGDKKIKIGIRTNEELINIGNKDKGQNEIKDDFNNVLNNNLNINKKFTNYNRKNKYNINNKILKSNNGNSYPSCNSTTSSGNKININNK